MIKPCGHRVIVKPDPVEEKTKAGIILAIDERLEKAGNVKGTLYKIGPTAWKAFDDGHPWAEEGDRVFFSKYAGKFILDPETEEEYVLLNDEDIVAVFTE